MRLEGRWSGADGDEAGLYGTVLVSRFPAGGRDLQQVAEQALRPFQNVENVQIDHSESQAVTLADGAEAWFVLVVVENTGRDKPTRSVMCNVFAHETANDDAYWRAAMSIIGPAEIDQTEPDSDISKLLQECVLSFAPSPAP